MRADAKYDNDHRTSEEVVRAYRQSLDTDAPDISLAVVHYRGGESEFTLGAAYARSSDSLDRETGAHVLSQLGWGDNCYLEESVFILLPMLHDPVPQVIAAAATALGHRHDSRAIPELLRLVEHPDPSVRLGIVSGLSGYDDVAAVHGLITLAKDADEDVRNWAAFGLGTQTDLDLPELRHALAALLDDSNPEIRGEALIGLAKRHDSRVKAPLIRELQGPFYGNWSLEAAELLADSSLREYLADQKARLPFEDEGFKRDFDSAILACSEIKTGPNQVPEDTARKLADPQH